MASALIPLGASVIGGLFGKDSANKATRAQTQGLDKALGLQERMFNQQREDLAPWRQAGGQSLGMLMEGLNDGSLLNGPDPSQFRADPGYQFRLNEAIRSVEGGAAARGMLMSGGTLKGVADRAGNMADQTYGDWFNRERAVQGDRYNRLAGVAGTGQAAVTTGAQMGQNYANSAGSLFNQQGQARASGYAAQNQALQGTLGNLFGMYSMGAFGK